MTAWRHTIWTQGVGKEGYNEFAKKADEKDKIWIFDVSVVRTFDFLEPLLIDGNGREFITYI